MKPPRPRSEWARFQYCKYRRMERESPENREARAALKVGTLWTSGSHARRCLKLCLTVQAPGCSPLVNPSLWRSCASFQEARRPPKFGRKRRTPVLPPAELSFTTGMVCSASPSRCNSRWLWRWAYRPARTFSTGAADVPKIPGPLRKTRQSDAVPGHGELSTNALAGDQQ